MASASEGRLHAFTSYDKLSRQTVVSNLRANIPPIIRDLKAYVVFKYSIARSAEGKRGKVPYYPLTMRTRSGTQGAPSDLRGMVSFSDAIGVYLEDKSVAGIGICCLRDNPVSFIDIDNCFDPETGEVSALAQEFITWGTYTEFSPGGRGLRLIVADNQHYDGKNLISGIELFSDKGYVTLTGLPFGKPKPVQTIDQEQLKHIKTLILFNELPKEETTSIPSPLTKERLRDVRAALRHIDPDVNYPEWLLVGQALHSGNPSLVGAGFRTWVTWSQKGSKFAYTSEEEMQAKWEGFKPGRGFTLASIFYLAEKNGYHGKQPRMNPTERQKQQVQFYVDERHATEQDLNPICPGLFDSVGAYMFIGRAKIGKSRVLGLMTVAALTGGEIFGFRFKEKCRVLALALEEHVQDVYSRLKLYLLDPSEVRGDLYVMDHDLFIEQAKKFGEDMDYAEWLDLAIGQAKAKFVYLDTLVRLRMHWMNEPEFRSKRITDQDYQMAAYMQELAVKHQCVIVFTIHGSKRKNIPTGVFDPFDSVGTTSWVGAGCIGSLVIMDKPNFNPLEEDDDGQRVFSIRGRFRSGGDAHLMLQTTKHGLINSLGDYRAVITTVRQQEILAVVQEAMDEGQQWITGQNIARIVGCTQRNVRGILGRFMRDGGVYNGRKLVAGMHHGYRLED